MQYREFSVITDMSVNKNKSKFCDTVNQLI